MSSDQKIDELSERFEQFAGYLRDQGCAEATIGRYRSACHHFGAWLHHQGIELKALERAHIERFSAHRCTCPAVFVWKERRRKNYLFQLERFVRFLQSIGVAEKSTDGSSETAKVEFREFQDWLRRHRGSCEQTIYDHVRTLRVLLPQLGTEPARYDAALINSVMLENLGRGSRFSAQRMCRSLRVYLRYLVANGECAPALLGAIPRIPRWRLATLPRYILQDDVERVIASCDLTTPRGLRDRAVLLLLSRLALRAGDIVQLQLEDIDWDRALIRVAGKSRHTVALPLAQEVGDALLAYIERVRPRIESRRVFLRVISPFRPFACSSAVTCIVREALRQSGVKNVHLRGAYLLRHSAATNMLRSGASLEAVGALLRHRSSESTTIYAKVDTSMLAQVAQAWIGGGSCR